MPRVYVFNNHTFSNAYTSGFTDYANDRNHVYYQGLPIENEHPDGARAVDPLHLVTMRHVYFKGTLMPEADAETFESLNYGYAKDRNQVYLNGNLMLGAEAETFEFLGDGYAKDKYRFYKDGKEVKEDKHIRMLLEQKAKRR